MRLLSGMNPVEQFIESCFSWPTLPASVLLSCVCFYWSLMIIGAVDLDFLDIDFDLDLDVDVDADISILQLGIMPLRFLNIGRVPTMLWISVFALSAWITSRIWNSPFPHPEFQPSSDILAIMRDAGVAVVVTKLVTQPLRDRFDEIEPNRSEDLIGRTCVITTSTVTDTFGEAEVKTDGAPLRLQVRNTDGQLAKGDSVVIVTVDNSTNTYFVKSA